MRSKALTLAPGDVVADAGGFTRIGADGRVLVYNSADQCPECGCGGQAPRACCAGASAVVAQNTNPSPTFPCDWTVEPADEGPLYDWCLGTGGTRWTLIAASIQGRTFRNFGFNTQTETISAATTEQRQTTATNVNAPGVTIRNVPASGSRRSVATGGSPSDVTTPVTTLGFDAGLRGLSTLGTGTRTGRLTMPARRCFQAAFSGTPYRPVSLARVNGGGAGTYGPPFDTDPFPSGSFDVSGQSGMTPGSTLSVARSWSVRAEALDRIRIVLSETVSARRPTSVGTDEFDQTFAAELLVEVLAPCPPSALQSNTSPGDQPTRWLGLEWEGRPMPLRVVDRLLGRRVPTCGCGCIRPLKRAWRRLLAPAPHPATV